jgi:cell pole-organizing protein PopZ
MNQPAKAQEPSMEEILASIRRIIADDDAHKVPAKAPETAAEPPKAVAPVRPPAPAPKPAPVVEAPHSQDEIDAMLAGLDVATPPVGQDVLQLTEQMATAAPEPPMFRTIDAQPDVFFSEDDAPPHPRDEQAPAFDGALERPLMSAAASTAVDQAFNALAHTVLSQNARTLEDLVREMMRPMLKAWLDDNLPGLVERMVRAEIERVSRGRTG